VILIDYAAADLTGLDEAQPMLYCLEGAGWVEATCLGYAPARFPTEDQLAVPEASLYLPVISR